MWPEHGCAGGQGGEWQEVSTTGSTSCGAFEAIQRGLNLKHVGNQEPLRGFKQVEDWCLHSLEK